MGFDPSVETAHRVELGTPFLNIPTAVIDGNGLDVSKPILFATSYLNAGQALFSAAADIGSLDRGFAPAFINQADPVLTVGDEVFIYTLEVNPGDTGLLIVVGIQVDFDAAPLRGQQPLEVQFNNLSGGPIQEYFWSFGDGKYSYTYDPVHVFEKVGLYTVSLRIRISLKLITYTRPYYIRVYPGGLIVARTTRCYRFAVLPEHGVGPSEYLGSAWPFPEARTGTIRIFDDNDQAHMLVLNNKDGYFYDISTRDGPPGSGLSRVWKDGADISGAGGTDILPTALFPEDRGGFEHYFLEHKESHIYARPYDEAVGFPSGLEFGLDIFEEGEPSDAAASTADIPLDGDIGFDKRIEAHRLQLKLSANMSQHLIVGRQQYYVASDRAAAPDKRIMTESDYQEEFSLPLLWIWTKGGTPADRAQGAALSLTATGTTGVDGESGSAIQFDAVQTFPSVAMTGAGELLFWYQGTLTVTIGGTPITMTDHGTYSGWTLAYASGITATGDLVITPTSGTVKIFDLRAFNTAITSGARAYYYTDVSNNSGNVMLVK